MAGASPFFISTEEGGCMLFTFILSFVGAFAGALAGTFTAFYLRPKAKVLPRPIKAHHAPVRGPQRQPAERHSADYANHKRAWLYGTKKEGDN